MVLLFQINTSVMLGQVLACLGVNIFVGEYCQKVSEPPKDNLSFDNLAQLRSSVRFSSEAGGKHILRTVEYH